MRDFLKQPLLHFLLAGVLIFVAYQFSDPVSREIAPPDNVI